MKVFLILAVIICNCAGLEADSIRNVKIVLVTYHFTPPSYEMSEGVLQWKIGGQYNTRDGYTCAPSKAVYKKLLVELIESGALNITEETQAEWNSRIKSGSNVVYYSLAVTTDQGVIAARIPYDQTIEVDGKFAKCVNFGRWINDAQVLAKYLDDNP